MKTKLIALFFVLIPSFCLAQTDENVMENTKYKALGGNIFLGKGFLGGNSSHYFTDPYFLGINVDLHRGKILIQFDDYIGLGKTKETMRFPDDLTWEKDKSALYVMLGGNLGYSALDSRTIKLVPLAGLGINLLSSGFLKVSDNAKNEPILPFYKIGSYIDLKSLKLFKNNPGFNNGEDYTCVRVSFGLNMPIGTPNYDMFYKGNMVYFTIGIGGLTEQ